ncbi:MAG: hypothetical protein ACE5JV_00105 [Nitrososphaerales archaeon]
MSSSPRDHGDEAGGTTARGSIVNPLALPYPWWYELYQRIKLVPWWLRYKFGIGREAKFEDEIVQLASSLGLQENWVRKVVDHAVTEFSKKGLGVDYYGYHSIDHELEATYFALLAAKGLESGFSNEDLCYLFVSALFHDFDPIKEFDKPNEEAVEWFIRHDPRIRKFIHDAGISIDIVMVLIHHTAFPFRGEIREKAEKRMDELFASAGIPEGEEERRRHYKYLGWFLSVAERVAGYALGDFERAVELAERNAHALGWHPSVINIESVQYFDILDEEKEMVEVVLGGAPEEYRKRFEDNVAKFREAYRKEMEIRDSVLSKKVSLTRRVEVIGPAEAGTVVSGRDDDPNLEEHMLGLYTLLPPPIRVNKDKFRKSLALRDTLLVTLRINGNRGTVVGYAKGGPLESYKLRRGTVDKNMGRKNTIYLEPMSIQPGYWGANGGHMLRGAFLSEAKKRGYRFLSAYAHRNVIERRMERGEPIATVCKYDPDRLDYYRLDLTGLSEEEMQALDR